MPFATIADAVAAIGRGEIVVVVDDEDRENEGDLIMAAEFATPEKIAFFVRHTSGLICAPDHGRAPRRARPPAHGARQHREPAHGVHRTRVDYRHGTSTGHLGRRPLAPPIQALIDPATRPGDLARPGHIFPLRYARAAC